MTVGVKMSKHGKKHKSKKMKPKNPKVNSTKFMAAGKLGKLSV